MNLYLQWYDRYVRIHLASEKMIAGMAQSVERRIGSAEVTGPIPVASLKEGNDFSFFIRCGIVATDAIIAQLG